jgi:hypothetical protein
MAVPGSRTHRKRRGPLWTRKSATDAVCEQGGVRGHRRLTVAGRGKKREEERGSKRARRHADTLGFGVRSTWECSLPEGMRRQSRTRQATCPATRCSRSRRLRVGHRAGPSAHKVRRMGTACQAGVGTFSPPSVFKATVSKGTHIGARSEPQIAANNAAKHAKPPEGCREPREDPSAWYDQSPNPMRRLPSSSITTSFSARWRH